VNNYSKILDLLADAPPGPHAQIDETICVKLRAMANADEVFAADLKQILDECAFASLASDFGMMAMDAVYRQMLQDESTSVSQ